MGEFKTLMVNRGQPSLLGRVFDNAIMVPTVGNPLLNARALLDTYEIAKTMTPGGQPLGPANRVSVFVPPGRYDFGEGVEAPAPVDVVITPDAVGDNPRMLYYVSHFYYWVDGSAPNPRSLLSVEKTVEIGDSTTSFVISGSGAPYWTSLVTIWFGETSGEYDTALSGILGFPVALENSFSWNEESFNASNKVFKEFPVFRDALPVSEISITPDAVGDNPVTYYYRVLQQSLGGKIIFPDTDYAVTIGESTTRLLLQCSSYFPHVAVMRGAAPGQFDTLLMAAVSPEMIPLRTSELPIDLMQAEELALTQELTGLINSMGNFVYDTSCLVLDADYVDIVGLSPDCSLQHLIGRPNHCNSGVIIQKAGDVRISNLTVEILTSVTIRSFPTSGYSAAYFPETESQDTEITNCRFKGCALTMEEPGEWLLFSTRLGCTYAGKYTHITGDSLFFCGLKVSGTFRNCTGYTASFFWMDFHSGEMADVSGNFFYCHCQDGAWQTPFCGKLFSCIQESSPGQSSSHSVVASAKTVTIVNGGAGYQAGDLLTAVLGEVSYLLTILVTEVIDGEITDAKILNRGFYNSVSPNPVSVTGGSGSNATFNVDWNYGCVYGSVLDNHFISELPWND